LILPFYKAVVRVLPVHDRIMPYLQHNFERWATYAAAPAPAPAAEAESNAV